MSKPRKFQGGAQPNRSNASPSGWHPPRELTKHSSAGTSGADHASGANPAKAGAIGRIIKALLRKNSK